jgi:hypothetical protein
MKTMTGDQRERTFAEDPSGILKTVELPFDTAPREMSADDDPGDVPIDAAVGRGAIPSSDREAWKRQYARAPEAVRDVLAGLPSDPRRAERAYEQDDRLRVLGDQFDRYMGVESEAREFDDASLSDDERLYKRLAELTNAPDAR